ncbi:SNF2-related protein [Myxococcota bacterium]|nr:SNF2-related protein [Myxococcota bacterium]
MTEKSSFVVGQADGWELLAIDDALVFRPQQRTGAFRIFSGNAVLPGDSVRVELESLVRQGHAEGSGEEIRIKSSALRSLEAEQAEFLTRFCSSLPCSVHVNHSQTLGHPEFQLSLEYKHGASKAYPEFYGCLARMEGLSYLVPNEVLDLQDEVAALNALSPEEKVSVQGILKRWAHVAIAAAAAEARTDAYLSGERVVVPEKIALNVVQNENGYASIVPTIEGVPVNSMSTAFLAENQVEDIYNLQAEDGGRTRIVVDEDVRPVLEAIRPYRRLNAREQDEVFSRPDEILPDGISSDVVDMSLFGPRVREIGEYPASVRAFSQAPRDWAGGLGEDSADDDGSEPNSAETQVGIVVEYLDGTAETETFDSPEEAESLRDAIESALARNLPVVEFRDRKLPVSEQLKEEVERCVRELHEREAVTPDPVDSEIEKDRGPSGVVGPLVWDNEEGAEYSEEDRVDVGAEPFARPAALRDEIVLKPHQEHGVQWLAQNVRDGKRGALLADDMGLGKTLQALTFAAWLIEQDSLATGLHADRGPWDPILVVCPVILLDVWREELEKFFDDSIFLPYAVLDSSALRKYRLEKGKEGKVAKSVLDLDAIRNHRLVISNYDAVTNYGFSFAKIRWSVVICDESHHFKEPSTRVSQVMKSLNTEFRVAMTGTPVVNRLMDVWNLVDFLRPLRLGSQKEFRDEFEPKNEEEGALDGARRLQKTLRVVTGPPLSSDSVVLRRSKEQELSGLPKKVEVRIECPLSQVQRDAYRRVQTLASQKGGQGVMFKVLSSLNRLLQHPALEGAVSLESSPSELLSTGPKVRALVDELRKIQKRGEKVLVFAILIKMQHILKRVLDEEFGLDVSIINGQSQSSGAKVRQRRLGMIKDFSAGSGFDVMILSPDVAGVGLTITAANHVFHFGRWWNPAREDQATDRTHRIGQEKDVKVYRLIGTDPDSELRTFDEHLDDLITERRQTAEHFLVPSVDDGEATESLGGRIFGDLSSDTEASESYVRASDLAALDPRRFEAFVAAWLQAQGYRAFATPYTGDAGVDALGFGESGPVMVQVKHVQKFSGNVSEDAVQEIRNGGSHYASEVLPSAERSKRQSLWVVTNGSFTGGARRRASEFGVRLIDGKELKKSLARLEVRAGEVTRLDIGRMSSLSELREQLRLEVPS